MKDIRLLAIMDHIEEEYVEEAEPLYKKKKYSYFGMAAVAICVFAVLAAGTRYLMIPQQSSSCLTALSEEEIFDDNELVIIRGTISSITQFDNKVYYLNISVDKVIQGSVNGKNSIKIKLISSSQESSIADLSVSEFHEGQNGIFLLRKCDDLLNVYEIPDQRYLFLEADEKGDGTENGIVYSYDIYKGLKDARNLEQVEEYIIRKIKR